MCGPCDMRLATVLMSREKHTSPERLTPRNAGRQQAKKNPYTITQLFVVVSLVASLCMPLRRWSKLHGWIEKPIGRYNQNEVKRTIFFRRETLCAPIRAHSLYLVSFFVILCLAILCVFIFQSFLFQFIYHMYIICIFKFTVCGRFRIICHS